MSNTSNFFKEKKEWSYVKDEILNAYLPPYLAKVGSMNLPITIVDCFAGKGKFDDGENGSPIIICEKVNNYLKGKPYSNINRVFIEKYYHNELKKNLFGQKNTIIYDGAFEDNVRKLCEYNKDKNIFFYIDPFGIKSLDFSRLQEIKNSRFKTVEMLINFNSKGFLREGCRILKYNNSLTSDVDYEDYIVDETTDHPYLNSIAGGDYWVDILDRYQSNEINLYQAEEEFMRKYMRQFNKIFKYVIDIPIKDKMKNIPKYRLIFGTEHIAGLSLMADNMKLRWEKMKVNSLKGQYSIFDMTSCDSTIDCLAGYEILGVDEELSYSLNEDIIKVLKSNNGKVNIDCLRHEIIKKYKFFFSTSDINKVLRTMEDDQQVKCNRKEEFTSTGKASKSMQKLESIEIGDKYEES